MRKYLLPVAMSLLSILTARAQQYITEFNKERFDDLTEEIGWAIHSRVIIAGTQVPKDIFPGMSVCEQSEVLQFRRDMTYVRTYKKKSCAKPMQETNGTWSYAADTAAYPGILTLQMTDLVDPRLSKNYSVGALGPGFQKDGALMLTPMPDDKPMEAREVTVYRRAKTAVYKGFVSLKAKEIEDAGQIANVWNLNRGMEQFGVLEYYYWKKEVGPSQVISYTAGTEEEYLVEIQTSGDGSRLVIYAEKPGGWQNVTGAMLGDFEGTALKAGFERWQTKYSDGTVTADRSDQQLVYSLASSNFLTVHPQIHLEIKVAWTDASGQEKEDARIIGSLDFNGKGFELNWDE